MIEIIASDLFRNFLDNVNLLFASIGFFAIISYTFIQIVKEVEK